MTDEQYDAVCGLLNDATARLKQIEARLIFMETRDSQQSVRTANYMPGVAGAIRPREILKGTL